MVISTDGVVLGVVAFVVTWISHRVWKWRNPRFSNGILPPGSMGFPLIGETLSLLIPSYSLDLHPFIKSRIQRYGPIFKTNIAGHPMVVSGDPELNSFLFQQEGTSVELWYLDTYSKLFGLEGESRVNAIGGVHKYLRNIYMSHFSGENLRKLMPRIEECVNRHLISWSANDFVVEVKQAVSTMTLDFTQQVMYNDPDKWTTDLSIAYSTMSKGFISFPLNVPGTKYRQCLKVRKSLDTMFRAMLRERRGFQGSDRADFLDQVVKDIDTEKYLSEDFMVNIILGGLFATFETIPTVVALAFKLLSEHPLATQEITAEHESILRKRKDPDSLLTWEEYKSMSFTTQVINETMRLGSISPGLLRKTLKDIPVKGFVIPKGWAILLLTSSLHLNPEVYTNPLEFNPWRWKELDSHVVSKNFMSFGGGIRQCAGSEYSRVFMATLFHVIFTKYNWKSIKMGELVRSPMLGFGEGIHIKIFQQQN